MPYINAQPHSQPSDPHTRRTVKDEPLDLMELIGLIIKIKALLIASLGVLGFVFAIVLAPFWLPILLFGSLALVSYAFYQQANADIRSAHDKVRDASRKVQEAQKRLNRARDKALLRAQREFEDAQSLVQDFALELENARNQVISDAESELDRVKAKVRYATESVKSAEQELAHLQEPRPEVLASETVGKSGVSVLLKHVRTPKQKLGASWHEIKTKFAESKLQNARDDLREANGELDEAADDLEVAMAHQSDPTKRHEAHLEISKSDRAEVARMLQEAKAHRSERTKKQEGKLLNAEQKYAQTVEKLRLTKANRIKMLVYFLLSLVGTIGIPVGFGFYFAYSG